MFPVCDIICKKKILKRSFASFLFFNQRCIKASEAKSKSICTMFLSGTRGEINLIVGFIHNWKFGKVPMQIYCAGMLKWMDFEEIFNLQFKLLWIVPHRFAGLNHITHCNYVIHSISRKEDFESTNIFVDSTSMSFPSLSWQKTLFHLLPLIQIVLQNTIDLDVISLNGNTWMSDTFNPKMRSSKVTPLTKICKTAPKNAVLNRIRTADQNEENA